MGKPEITSVECHSCREPHTPAAGDRIVAGKRVACTRCGSKNVKVKLRVAEMITIRDSLDLKARRPGFKRPVMEQRLGDDLHRASGRWRKIRRVFDRGNDRYIEHIVDDEGTTVRTIDVPLSEHRGHGSDDSRPKAHP